MSTIEQQVTDRIAREREQLTHRHSALDAEHGEAITAADAALDHLSARGRNAYQATEPDLDDLKAAFAAAERSVKKAIGTGRKVWDVALKLQALDADGEVERRVAEAKALEETRASGRRLSAKTLAVAALIRKGSAMHYRDITKAIIDSGLITLKGNTPEATVNAMLAVASKKGDTFEKVAPGVFDLIDREATADGEDVTGMGDRSTLSPRERTPQHAAAVLAADPEVPVAVLAAEAAAQGTDPAPEVPEPATEPETAPTPAKAPKAKAAAKKGGTGSNQNESKRDRSAAAKKAAATRKAKREAAAKAADKQEATA